MNIRPEYPRPQMKRDQWLCLNGEWSFQRDYGDSGLQQGFLQKKFDEKFELGFPLLADEGHLIAEAYGVWGEKSKDGKAYMGIVRSSFLIDEDGKILEAWYKVSPEDTVPNLKKLLKQGKKKPVFTTPAFFIENY